MLKLGCEEVCLVVRMLLVWSFSVWFGFAFSLVISFVEQLMKF